MTTPTTDDRFFNAVAEGLNPSGPEFLVQERKKQHGNWIDQSRLSHQLKETMRRSKNWSMLEHHQAEALDMIATKISRILTGDAGYADHWDDIGGYALLGKGGHPDEGR